jgi:hypothetical protein
MPEFYDVARHFDDVETRDGYNPLSAPVLRGQFSTFVEAAPDGSTSNRRVLSLAPNVTLPLRRVIKLHDELWVVGQGITDMFQNRAVRTSYWMKKVYALFNKLTPLEACTGLTGLAMYGHRVFLKNTVNGVTDSGYEPFWNLYFGVNESFQEGSLLRDSYGTWYRCRVTYTSDEGFRMVEADQIDAPVSVTYGSNPTYNAELDVLTSVPVIVQGFVIQGSKLYEFFSEHDKKYAVGDCSLITSVALTPETSVSAVGKNWLVLDCQPHLDGYASHIRAVL